MIYLDLLIGFLKVGLFAFGGAYGAIPLIRDVVLAYGWLNDEMLTYMIAVSESTPGPIMVNLATYVGSSQAGFPGALIATAAVVLPSFIIILLIMVLLKKLLKNPYVQAILRGMKPCIIGIILATGLYMILHNCVDSSIQFSLNTTAIIMTVVLSAVYFGSGKILKKGDFPYRTDRYICRRGNNNLRLVSHRRHLLAHYSSAVSSPCLDKKQYSCRDIRSGTWEASTPIALSRCRFIADKQISP